MKKLGVLPKLLIFPLIGFTAIIAQIVFLREFLVIFYGNEITLGIILANWLFWTAAGSYSAGKLTRKYKNFILLMAILQVSIALVTPATILFIRFSKNLFNPIPGEVFGFFPVFIDSLLILAPFCLISGAFFSVGSHLYRQYFYENFATSSGTIYLLEAIGSGLGGIFTSIVLIPNFTPIQITIYISVLNLLAASYLVLKKIRLLPQYGVFFLNLILLGLLLGIYPRLDKISISSLWKNFNILETHNSIYGNLTLVENNQVKTLFENGLIVYNFPDVEAAEESIHYPLLLHPHPQEILLIGGGIAGGIREALKHPSLKRIDYLELDPYLFDLAKQYFTEEWREILQHPKVLTYVSDGRLFLNQQSQKYDVIIVNLPDPQTAQINRFYTVEFFKKVSDHLNPNGLLAFQVSAAENYISQELGEFLACLERTLEEVFQTVLILPGETAHFFASDTKNKMELDPKLFLENLKNRDLKTIYVSQNILPYRLMPDRLQELDRQLRQDREKTINRDFVPTAYYFNLILWSSKFLPFSKSILHYIRGINFLTPLLIVVFLLLMGISLTRIIFSKQKSAMVNSLIAVWMMGFTLISLELLILLAFQAIYGFVYYQIATIIAAFMTGMALGSWLALKHLKKNKKGQGIILFIKKMIGLHGTAAIFPLLTLALFNLFKGFGYQSLFLLSGQIAFPLIAIVWGLLGGYQFLYANSIYFTSTNLKNLNIGLLYGLDLLGALVGSLVLSIFVVPLFGFVNALILVSALNSVVVLAFGLNLFSYST